MRAINIVVRFRCQSFYGSERQNGYAESNSSFSVLYLFHRALRWLLIRTPAQELCPVTKAAAGEVIVLNFDHEFWREGFPVGRSIGAPAAGAAGRAAGEAGWFD